MTLTILSQTHIVEAKSSSAASFRLFRVNCMISYFLKVFFSTSELYCICKVQYVAALYTIPKNLNLRIKTRPSARARHTFPTVRGTFYTEIRSKFLGQCATSAGSSRGFERTSGFLAPWPVKSKIQILSCWCKSGTRYKKNWGGGRGGGRGRGRQFTQIFNLIQISHWLD